MANIISVTDLSKKFQSKNKGKSIVVDAVSSINFDVKKGEIFGFLGTNGAGKSTTIDILTTRLLATSGNVKIAQYDLSNDTQSIRKIIGCVSQKGGADTIFNATENLLLQARLYGIESDEASKKSSLLLESFKLTDISNRQVSTYSGGQKRRLELAMGLINDPEILFLDEPTTGLDPQSRSYFWDKIIDLKNKGVTIFLTTHYLDEAEKLCDTIAIMDKGKILDIGNPESMKRELGDFNLTIKLFDQINYDKANSVLKDIRDIKEVIMKDNFVIDIFLERNSNALSHITKLLSESNVVLETINMHQPTLNDIFLKKTGKSLKEN